MLNRYFLTITSFSSAQGMVKVRYAKKNRENLFSISCFCVCSHKVVAPHCRYHAKSIFSSFERIHCSEIPNKVYDATQHKGSA